ncbi:U4/U6 small nuclear ribonucleoprotein Prp3 isoform X1 [Scaptodrosophila lebanonensis]|uniref:U4/U6 small nuclear ribonucleoprotein Prp3 isoform X1 n=2 Tax=Drosophila lebanonensis TaxID=7225 RepID=A0A6J2TBE8_DROLE|nr:U4/U6 small nuclear ribonucleoprotein Prp3 isoform X1 [Scaptodrosophila lebanonensis]
MSSIITRKDVESVDAVEQQQKVAKKRSADAGSVDAPKKSRFDVKEKNGAPAIEMSSNAKPSVGSEQLDAATAAALSSSQIKLMMAHAQREIEERKRALSNLRDKDPLLASVPQIGMPVALATQALAKKPTPEDADKAKKIAELQAQIRAKLTGNLANLIQPTAVAAAAAAAAQQQERPKPLILDAEGRTVDKSGRTINIPTVTPTLKANIRAKKREGFQRQTHGSERGGLGGSGTAGTLDDGVKYFDERITQKPMVRNKRTLRFHEPGKFQQLAERMRMKSQLERLQNEISQIARKTGISSATKLALIAPKQDMPDDVPAMEWWDSVILTQDLQTVDETSGEISIRQTAISNLIEHPTQMKPPNEPLKPVYLPVFLTKKERKKLRRQNRREAWKEEQEKIRLGLVAPPEPKLRISNLMRVLGTDAVQDPTKIEAHVREQMAKRQKAHEDANNARKLTAEQKSEKKVRKLKEDTTCGVHVSVYRIRDLQDNQSKKFKVETNAKQLQMTGSVALFRDCCVVVVEGGPKQQKKYRRLMLHRIKWEEDIVKGNDGQDVPNSCVLVWEGTSQRRHFGEIKFKIFPMEKMAREFFQKHQVEHYWDLAYSGAVLEASTDQQ